MNTSKNWLQLTENERQERIHLLRQHGSACPVAGVGLVVLAAAVM
jgi:hypothetical protein